jgi:hypothetical protein
MRSPIPFVTMRSVLAMSLILWCAGTGCMIVSYAHGAAMVGGNESPHASGESLSSHLSMASHECCKAKHSSAKHTADLMAMTKTNSRSDAAEQMTLPELPAPSGAMSCCPLTSGTFVAASRTQSNDNDAAPAQSDSDSPSLTDLRQPPLVVPLRLPPKDHTYLRCCVFLI